MKFHRFSVPLLLLFVLLILCGLCEFGNSMRGNKFIGMKLGGFRDVQASCNSAEIDSFARFAIQEHNKKEVFSLISSIDCSVKMFPY